MSLLLIGKIQTLLDRLTSGRAAALDAVTETRMARLDAAVSTRAASASALSNATWTDARAAKVDNLDAVLSTLPGRVKSIQTGTVQISDGSQPTVSISSVVTGKSIILVHAYRSWWRAADNIVYSPYVTFNSPTQLQISTSATGIFDNDTAIKWTVVEYY